MDDEQDVVDGGEIEIVEEPCVTRGQIMEDPLRAGVLVCDEPIPLGERFTVELVCTVYPKVIWAVEVWRP